MYAIVETSGRQFRVEEGDTIQVDRIQAEVGAEIVLDRVLLVHGAEVRVGTPLVSGAKVKARVKDHNRGQKVITFKYRPTRRQRRRVGFRHSHTQLEILGIEA